MIFIIMQKHLYKAKLLIYQDIYKTANILYTDTNLLVSNVIGKFNLLNYCYDLLEVLFNVSSTFHTQMLIS